MTTPAPQLEARKAEPFPHLDRLISAGWGDTPQKLIPAEVWEALWRGEAVPIFGVKKKPQPVLIDCGPCRCGCGEIVFARSHRGRYINADHLKNDAARYAVRRRTLRAANERLRVKKKREREACAI